MSEMNGVATEMYALWQPRLYALRELYTENTARLFPGLVAFCGLQLTLWPLWLKACDVAGAPLPPELREQRLRDPDLLKTPWRTLFGAASDRVGWVLVGGDNLGDSTKFLAGLHVSDVLQSLASVQPDGNALVYGRASDTLNEWGIYKGNSKPLTVPRVSVEVLERDYSRWVEAARPLQKPLEVCVHALVTQGHRDGVIKQDFHQLAAALWRIMQEDGLIRCGESKGSSFLNILGLKKAPEQFESLFLILGDHQALWNTINKEE